MPEFFLPPKDSTRAKGVKRSRLAIKQVVLQGNTLTIEFHRDFLGLGGAKAIELADRINTIITDKVLPKMKPSSATSPVAVAVAPVFTTARIIGNQAILRFARESQEKKQGQQGRGLLALIQSLSQRFKSSAPLYKWQGYS